MAAALLWRNLSVFEPSSGCHISAELKEEKRILKGINGAILYKSLNAIMGPSGAGKTTLLKCLFGTSSIKYTGSIFVGDRCTKAVFISQNEEDHLLLNLTVEESIRFACKVKNNSSCRLMSCIMNHGKSSPDGKKPSSDADLVSSLIDQLDLERCRHTLARKCSGGQKKRLAIAQELASKIKPKIIFMDEPTSGIDSSVSYLVLRQLQSLSQRNGIAILCTIHQPSYKILELFDQLYILSRRGRVMYDGKPQFLRPHLLRYSFPCPDGHNPADVVIELASTETRKDQVHLKPGCLGFCSTISIDSREGILGDGMIHAHTPTQEIQKIETLEKVAEIECEEIVESLHIPSMVEVKKLCSSQSPKTIFHTWFLFKRSFINSVWREPRWLMIRFALHVLVAVILTLLYDGQVGLANGCLKLVKGATSPSSSSSSESESEPMCRCPTSDDMLKELKADNLVGKNVAFLFFNLMFLMFAALMPTVLTFPAEMKVFLNEHRNGWYSTRSYYWAKNFVELLVQLPLPYAYSLYIYWWTGQLGLSFDSDSRFNQFVLITILSSFIAQGVGLMIGAIFTHNFNISIFVSTIFMMFNFLFSGFFIKIDQMENVEFLTKFSFTRFAFEAIIVAVYGDRCKSAPSFDSLVPPPAVTTAAPIAMAFASPSIRSASNSWTPITSSPSILIPSPTSSLISSNSTTSVISTIMYQFNVKEDIFNESILWLILHLIGWRVCTYVTLWWKANPDSFNKKFFFVYFAMRRGCSVRKFLCTILSFLIFAMVAVAAFTFFLW